MVKAADTWDFESDNNYKFKVLEHEHDTECDEWNAESTLKLKDVVVSVRQQFKWQSIGADATLKEKPFVEWLAPWTLALRLVLMAFITGNSSLEPLLIVNI